jgi:hypothetical protein
VDEAQPASVPPRVGARRLTPAPQQTAAILGVLAVALLIASLPLSDLSHQLTFNDTSGGVGTILFFGGVGVLVARRQSHNPVGWLLIGYVLLAGLSVDAGYYTLLRYHLGHRGLPLGPVAVLLTPLWVYAYAVLPLVILLFPDGRLPSRRWRWVLAAYAGLVTCALIAVSAPAIAAIAGNDIRVDSSGDVRSARGLPGLIAHPPWWATAILLVPIAVIALSFVTRQALRWRRATGVYRQQLKWLALGAGVTIGVGGIAANFAPGIWSEILAVAIAAMPVSIGIGILRYRLYDIDRIISRTLAYTIATAALAGLYAGLVLLATEVLSLTSQVAVAAATLAAAALFNPLRRRVQRLVDRRFNRARYDAEQTLAAFAARLKGAVDLDSVRADLTAVVQQTLEPVHMSVWLSQPLGDRR